MMLNLFQKRPKDVAGKEAGRNYLDSVAGGGVTIKRHQKSVSMLSLQSCEMADSTQFAVERLGADRFHKLSGDQRVVDYKDMPIRCGRATGCLRPSSGRLGGGWMSISSKYTGPDLFPLDAWEPCLDPSARRLRLGAFASKVCAVRRLGALVNAKTRLREVYSSTGGWQC